MNLGKIGMIKGISCLVLLLVTLRAEANTIVELSDLGVGYFPTIIPPTGVDNTVLNNMIGVYNGTLSTSGFVKDAGALTPATLAPSISLGKEVGNQSGTTDTIDLGAGGYTYLIAQWDGGNAADAVYYIGGLTGKIDLVNDLPNGWAKYGISGYWLANAAPTVPDGGMTILLLGTAISGIALLRRKIG